MNIVIFGCGNIANRVAQSCQLVDELNLFGFASKDIDKAIEYAKKYNVEHYGNYDDFLNDESVDAIYITTFNQSHYELINKSLEHKKHVICEKPMVSSIYENKESFELARKNNVLLMEALKSVFLPLNIKIKQLIDNNVIGETKEIYASFMRAGCHPKDHWINEKGCGGALKDLGSYCIGTMNYLMDKSAELVSIETDEKNNKADTTAYVNLKYGDVKARAAVSNSIDGDMFLHITGSNGEIHADNFWKSGKGYYISDGRRYEIEEELISDFYYELKHFVYLVDNHILMSDIMSEKASENILKITDYRKEKLL